MEKLILVLLLFIAVNLNSNSQTVSDFNGNIYQTVSIGTQVWMKENLKTTKYKDGSAITLVTDTTLWKNTTSGAYCNYNNDTANVAVYGRLYNGYVVTDPRKVCPDGWHVPSDDEWKTLVTYLGGEKVAGGKMKETVNSIWKAPNTGATNSSGFSARPGGARSFRPGTDYFSITEGGNWWSNTYKGSDLMARSITNEATDIYNFNHPINYGFSIRCLKDAQINSVNALNKNYGIVISPNPTTGLFTISFGSTPLKQAKAEIYNSEGKRILTKVFDNTTSAPINLTSQPKGIYLVKLMADGILCNQKICIE